MIPVGQVGEIEFQCCVVRLVISKRLQLKLARGESKRGLKGKEDEFRGKPGTPPGEEQCPMWSSWWARGELMVMEECRMKVRGKNPGQEALMGIDERISSGAFHPC
jgi:hypothetical protein